MNSAQRRIAARKYIKQAELELIRYRMGVETEMIQKVIKQNYFITGELQRLKKGVLFKDDHKYLIRCIANALSRIHQSFY